jgi:hypothetical protein
LQRILGLDVEVRHVDDAIGKGRDDRGTPFSFVPEVRRRHGQRAKRSGGRIVDSILTTERAEIRYVLADAPSVVRRELDAIVPIPPRHDHPADVDAEAAGGGRDLRLIGHLTTELAGDDRRLDVLGRTQVE